jgi:hypothetical protein
MNMANQDSCPPPTKGDAVGSLGVRTPATDASGTATADELESCAEQPANAQLAKKHLTTIATTMRCGPRFALSFGIGMAGRLSKIWPKWTQRLAAII